MTGSNMKVSIITMWHYKKTNSRSLREQVCIWLVKGQAVCDAMKAYGGVKV